MNIRVRTRSHQAWIALSWAMLVACKRTPSDEPTPTNPPAASASATTMSSTEPNPPAASAQPSASEPRRVFAQGMTVASGQATPLGKTGLTFTPSFKGELNESGTGWRFKGAGATTASLYLLRKTYEPGSPMGPLPCNETMKRESDGVVRRCKDDTGTWFSRDVAIDDEGYKTLLCMGDSKSAPNIAAIEATCRSIRKAK